MKNSFFLFPIIILWSCGTDNQPNPETDVETLIDTTSDQESVDQLLTADCYCSELVFDEPYNHFFLTERREGFTGKCQDFHENGKLKMEKNFVNGKLHGKFFLYYNNGQIEEEKEFDTNFQTGEQITYSKKGEVIFHALYKRGKQTDVLVTRPDIPKVDPWDEEAN